MFNNALNFFRSGVGKVNDNIILRLEAIKKNEKK